jgi:hypothetical protein
MKAINILTLREGHVSFIIRIVQQGQKYGRDFKQTHELKEPLVEIYDADYNHTPFGQYISCYYLDTLRNRDPHSLAFNGGIEKWRIGAANAVRLQQWLLGLGEWE